MNFENFKYIICDSNKRPVHSFSQTFSYEEVKDKDNVAIKMEEPYIIIDIDEEEQFNILVKILADLNIKTRILKTSRGGHFWFKSYKPLKNVVHCNTPLTLDIDIKSWGKQTMEMVKKEGVWRTWIHYDEDVDVIPRFLLPIRYKKDVLHFKEGDGRDNALFTYIIPLINERFTKEEIKYTFTLINKYIFDEPLEDSEIDKMFDSNVVFTDVKNIFYDGPKFKHNVFADFLIEEFNIKGYQNKVYFYENNQYTNNLDLLTSKMLDIIPELVTRNIKETMENIRLKMMQRNEDLNSNYINLKNGLYNLITKEFISHTPSIFCLNQLDCYYNPDAYDDNVYNVLRSLACEDEDIITLLIQMLGYFLLPDCRFQKSFILLGNGRNGKSMFLEMIRNWLGDDNCSSLALEDLSQRFKSAELIGKMINIGDDSGHNLLQNTAIFKKLVTGDSITIEMKNVQPFKFVNTSKMIFAANTLPPTTDKSEGFFRRCIIIPFNARYLETDKNYDPKMIDKISTENAKAYLLQLAIKGLDSLIENNKFYESSNTKSISSYYELSNNNIMMWWQSKENKTYNSYQEAFGDYLLYCANSNYKPSSVGRFQQEFEKLKRT